MLRISCAGCLGLSPAISAQFTLEMGVTVRHRGNVVKLVILGIQIRLRLSMLIPVKSASPVLVTIGLSSMFMLINVQNISLYTC